MRRSEEFKGDPTGAVMFQPKREVIRLLKQGGIRMKKLSLAILMLVALSQWAALAMAQGPGMGGPRGHHHMMGGGFGMLLPPFILGKLNLTDDQKAKVQEIMDAHRQTLQTLSPQLQTLHEQMADKFSTSGSLTDTDFTSPTQDMNRLREQLAAEDLKVSLAIRALLTPDQLAQVAQIRAQMQALHAQMQSVFEGQ
jgi:Spy/CpxP family protein refolding chaperone